MIPTMKKVITLLATCLLLFAAGTKASAQRLENSSHSTIGYYSGVKEEWVAYYFFFFAK